MDRRLRVLLVEDNPDDAALVSRALERGGYPADITRVEERAEMEAALARGPWDLIIADHSLPRFSSSAAIETLRAVDEDVGCIIVSGSLGEEAVVQAMRAGADDYLLKDRLGALPAAVGRTFRTAEARRERRRAEGRYRSLVESAPDGVVVLDRQGIVTSLNPAFEAMTGFSIEAAMGRPFRDFVHPADAPELTAGFAAALAQATPLRTQIRLLHASTLHFHADLTVARLVEAGVPAGLFGIFRDVTDRRTMERELRRSETHLHTLVEHAPDGLFTIATTGELLSVNPAFEMMVGPQSALIGRHFREFVHPDDLTVALDAFSRVLRDIPTPAYELRLCDPGGRVVEVEVTSARLTEGTVVAGILSIARDITTRKQTQRELMLREERFRLVTLATQDAVYDWDLGRGTIWWSEGAAKVFGLRPPATEGPSWWISRLHPDDRTRVLDGRDRAMEHGNGLWSEEYRFRHADGEYRTLRDHGQYLYDDDGRPSRIIGAMTDVTERRRSEEEQRRLQAALQAAATDWRVTFDAVPLMMILVDQEARIRRLNLAARDGLGAPWDRLVHHSLRELAGQPWEAVTELHTRALQASETLMEQFEESPNGRTWSMLATPVSTPEGPSAILTLRDTTDLVQLQRTLAHERTMAALGALVAGVAHEVRNPLFAISATLDAFEARFGQEPDFSRYVDRLRPEVHRLSALMRDLLEYGRPPVLQPVVTEVTGVVREAIARNETAMSARGIRVELRAPHELTPVRHDPARLLQVVQNLLDNALVHAPQGTAIGVTLGPVADGTTHWFRIVIEDEGAGFRAEDIAHVFEPFYSRRRGGTGLGLSIVERLVGQHGGKVTAENRAEGGARVTVLLPLS